MFAIPLIAVPFLLCLVPYRLCKIVLRLFRGEIGFSPAGRPLLPVLTVAIYLGLAAHTVLLLLAVARLASSGHWSLQRLEPSLFLGGGYPLTYLAAEWIFFYGLRPVRTPSTR
jgi:hypothetical protein